MKIGILTYHRVPNFGAQLQAVSTYSYLKKYGHDVVLIDWYPEDVKMMYSKRVPRTQIIYHDRFIESYTNLSIPISNYEKFVRYINEENFDMIFIGSDAVFKYKPKRTRIKFKFRQFKYVEEHVTTDLEYKNNPFWGGFLRDLNHPIPIVGFSVSCQNTAFTKLNEVEKQDLSNYMALFKFITARDEWTAKMISYLGYANEVPITPDPVFSFNQNIAFKLPTKKEILRKFHLPESYVLFSFRLNILKSKYINSLIKYFEDNNYTTVSFPMPEGLKAFNTKYAIDVPLSPIDWYCLIKYASGYIGERMHPIIVCIHNSTPFFCFDEYGIKRTIIPKVYKYFNKESSKIYHILKCANMLDARYGYFENHLLPTKERIYNCIIRANIKHMDKFSERYAKQYSNSMNNLISKLK